MTVDATFTMAPTGVRKPGALSDVPVTGLIVGHYDGNSDSVTVKQLTLNTPQSTLTANGTLGVNTGDRLTALNVDLSLRNLGEYDQLLRTLNLTGNGKVGAAAIPITLHGTAKFHGTATGEIAKLDVKGHLEANNLEFLMGDVTAAPVAPAQPANLLTAAMTKTPAVAAPTAATDVHIDSLVADADYTPTGLSVASSTITQGSAVLHLLGSFKARTFMTHKHPDYAWDGGTAADIQVQLGHANVVDVLTIAGSSKRFR